MTGVFYNHYDDPHWDWDDALARLTPHVNSDRRTQ